MSRWASSFDIVLEEIARESDDGRAGRAYPNPFAAAAAPFASAYRAGPGATRVWEEIAEEVAAPDEDEAPPVEDLPRDDIESVARELDLPHDADARTLQAARRDFMWRHHPDRRPDLPAERATRRVAIANMLVDRALARLQGRIPRAGARGEPHR